MRWWLICLLGNTRSIYPKLLICLISYRNYSDGLYLHPRTYEHITWLSWIFVPDPFLCEGVRLAKYFNTVWDSRACFTHYVSVFSASYTCNVFGTVFISLSLMTNMVVFWLRIVLRGGSNIGINLPQMWIYSNISRNDPSPGWHISGLHQTNAKLFM